MDYPVYRSELVYKAPVQESVGPAQPKLVELAQRVWDAVWEYQGSVKGDYGEWRFAEWVVHKTLQVMGRSGAERK